MTDDLRVLRLGARAAIKELLPIPVPEELRRADRDAAVLTQLDLSTRR